jgi:membrane protein
MKRRLKDLGELFKTTYQEWKRKDPFRESAVIAYYAIFAIPGLLFLIITITGRFFGREKVNSSIVEQVSDTMGPETGRQIAEMLERTGTSENTIIGTVIGLIVLLLGATGVFVELQKALNAIWMVKVEPKKGILKVLRARLFSFGLILAIAFLLLISLVISTALAAFSDWISADSSEFIAVLLTVLNFIISLAVISVLFAMMFKILPDAKIKWRHVWLGSVVTGILFTLGKTGLAFYFGKAEPASAYGAAGSVILILLWVSYSSMILFFGAEFTAAYAQKYSGTIKPTAIAKPDLAQKILKTL